MLKRNVVANYLGAGAAAVMPILALPYYLGALGPGQYGLLGFVAMLQTVLSLLDAGMSQALVREVAVRFNAQGGGLGAAQLLKGFERLYWGFSLAAGVVTCLLANAIASRWLKLDGMDPLVVTSAIYGAAAIFLVQFPGSIYRSVLVGLQAQVALNTVSLVGVLVRHIGGVIVVLAWPTLLTYLLWQASIALLETLARRGLAWRKLDVSTRQVTWDPVALQSVWKTVATMSVVVWLGALTGQMDKIILSRMVNIEQFGYYTIAVTVAVGVLQMIYPLTQAVLPRAIQLRSDPVALRALCFQLAGAILAIVVVGGGVFALAGQRLLGYWIKNPQAVDAIYPLMSVLLVGTGLNAFYNVGYLHWLVHEKVKSLLFVNALALALSVLVVPPLIMRYGSIGAAFAWVFINLLGLLLSLGWLKNNATRDHKKNLLGT